jgi:hypothetical protein
MDKEDVILTVTGVRGDCRADIQLDVLEKGVVVITDARHGFKPGGGIQKIGDTGREKETHRLDSDGS